MWYLEVAEGQKIKLTFESLDIEAHASCRWDWVQVSFGSEEQKYCGSNKPSPIISSGNTMTVLFHSDQSVTHNGFKATWKALETSGMLLCILTLVCYYIINISSGKIKSPNYPADYPKNVDEVKRAY